ncbi:hypothetical protein BD626DRAFT_410903 [Schizophyllum amplum]|uniref:NAD-dependent epimerase/dehydratase domain-containing protein n=1 Tax=Schizophyllum amplum TaxID=97359 RepID=A0A550C072_9AGAR|nr:hypothetical protein BD626DRAFT_410903 [Auriculariopsis ampla]
MPAVSAPAKVLVSGANGYVAMWVVRTLLEKGYSVRGTVRSPAKGAYLTNYFRSYGDKFELAIVDDITKDGAFDEAVKGVDAVEHTASPFHFKATDPEELIVPAVNGTRSMLRSILKNGESVKRVVVTSSVASILEARSSPTVFTDKDWNQASIDEVEKHGKNATSAAIYRASKTLAEKAAWEIYNANKGKIQWDLVTVCPPFVFGPAIHEVDKAAALNTSAADWYNTVVNEDNGWKSDAVLTKQASAWVDVRDVGSVHELALSKDAASEKRIIGSAGPFTWQAFIEAAHKVKPNGIANHPKLAKGAANPPTSTQVNVDYDTTTVTKDLGFTFMTMEQSTKDTLEDFEKRGW